MSPRERLVFHVQELERLDQRKADASADFTSAMEDAKAEGYDAATLKAVLKLRKMTPAQRADRRALEAIYLAGLGMLEGQALPDEARRRLDGLDEESKSERTSDAPAPADRAPEPSTPEALPKPEQPPLIVKDPAEARQEGADAAAAGKRIYDNPYPAGPCRASWDEGWCAQQKSHGMETPTAYRRRTENPAKGRDGSDDKDQGGDAERGAA